MELKVSLSFSQKQTIGPCPKPHEYSPHLLIFFIVYFYFILPSIPKPFKWTLFFGLPCQNFVVIRFKNLYIFLFSITCVTMLSSSSFLISSLIIISDEYTFGVPFYILFSNHLLIPFSEVQIYLVSCSQAFSQLFS